MARRRSSLSLFRSMLYGLARLLGDLQAVRRGPNAVAKRLARRSAGKVTGRMVGKFFRQRTAELTVRAAFPRQPSSLEGP
jgi:hypothetical protein